jgi:hypothetical protein
MVSWEKAEYYHDRPDLSNDWVRICGKAIKRINRLKNIFIAPGNCAGIEFAARRHIVVGTIFLNR